MLGRPRCPAGAEARDVSPVAAAAVGPASAAASTVVSAQEALLLEPPQPGPAINRARPAKAASHVRRCPPSRGSAEEPGLDWEEHEKGRESASRIHRALSS